MSRTQLRLQQMTGSIADLAYSGSQSSATANGSLALDDLGAVLGEYAGSIGRITGRTSDFTNSGVGSFDTALHVTGSGRFLSFQNAAEINTGAGALGIEGAGGINIATGTAVAVDFHGTTIDIDGTGALTIDTSDTTTGVTIGTANSGVPISIGHTTSEVTVNDNLTVTGDLTVNGATTTVDTTNLVVQDPFALFGIGQTSANANTGIVFVSGSSAGASRPDVVFGRKANDVWGLGSIASLSGSITSATGMTHDIRLQAKGFVGDLTGSVLDSSLTNNRVVIVGTGGVLEDDGNFTFDGSDLKLADNIGLVFDSAGTEKIESNGTDLTISSGGDIDITAAAGGDVNIPQDIGLTFGANTQKIEGNASNDLTIEAANDIFLDANGGEVVFQDGGTIYGSAVNNGGALILSSALGNTLSLDSNDGTAGQVSFNIQGTEYLRITDTTAGLGAAGAEIKAAANGETLFISGSAGIFLYQDVDTTGGNLINFATAGNQSGFLDFGSYDLGAIGEVAYIRSPQVAGNIGTLVLSASDDVSTDYAGMIGFTDAHVKSGGMTGEVILLSTGSGGTNDVATFVSNFSANTSILGAINSAYSSATGGDLTRGSYVVGTQVTAGNAFSLSTATEGDNISFASLADTAAGRGRKVEVYVNGQLMLTGSVAQVITDKVRDYRISADTELRFGFDIEVDDVVTVITR